MEKTNFLLRLKLQKGLGYVKMLQIASQLDDEQVTVQTIKQMTLPAAVKEASLAAYKLEKYGKVIKRIKKQCQVISFFDDNYPEQLRQIYQPPLILFARGDITLLQKRIVTIVGSRQATAYSQQVLAQLVPNLVNNHVVIASGLAKGVDVLAHQATLQNHGKTIAVVGNGLNHYYPMVNHQVQEQIMQKGLILSEYLPDTPPRPFRFPERNRILAGLAESVVVTEAKEKSGSLITANLALQENRNVYAVPGPITSPLSAGPNKLIAVGANPITDFKLNERFDN
ncbi:DNA-processing protein DprA [Lactobacillus sp. ESL0731]|uniref:DNA-processing protein DprA n=1 Tax=unclassified Lactobacillus TaxID=2620435 RepID=UPI0023F70715|nr:MULTISPECIES: DNA-processing protein DprA [unclassified Lactobacillus]WEV51996.1 DNA-processing protein DprA [Lactobacillus sp. ESL0700]WEV63127.1 DNA-processing protein DprA [Lactobacillus sp. ESL0731]